MPNSGPRAVWPLRPDAWRPTGFTRREPSDGPVLMWAGVATMIGVVVFYILRNLGG